MTLSIADMRKTCGMIMADAVPDALTLDGQPFDARTVAVNFGNLYAMVHTLAAVLDTYLAAEAAL